jgi:ferredoxin
MPHDPPVDASRRAPLFHVVIQPSGVAFDAPADRPLLESAREAGVVLPSSCRNGTCRACLARLVSGRVVYRIEWPGLSADEKADGFVLPCCAYPAAALVLAAPRATGLSADPL